MEVRIENQSEWSPVKLEIVFDSREEYDIFKMMVNTNVSIPEAVFGNQGFGGYSVTKKDKLWKILNKISEEFRDINIKKGD